MALTDGYYDYSHLALISIYGLLSIFSVISYIRSPTKKSFFTISFHFILLLGSLCRALSFSLFIINEENIKTIDGNLLFLMNELPSFLYLSFFSTALLLSIELFQSSLVVKPVDIQKLTIIVGIVNVILYCILALLFGLDFGLFPHESASVDQPTSVFQMIIQFIAAFIYLASSVAYFVFLFYTYYEHYDDKFADALKTQDSVRFRKRSNSIIFFAFLCFFIRSIMTGLTVFLKLGFWYKDLIYYSIFEVLPISLLLYIINEMAYKAGNTILFSSLYKPLTENSKLTDNSQYLYSKYSSNGV